MLNTEELKAIKIITVEGTTFVGIFDKGEGNTLIVKEGMKIEREFDKDMMLAYALKKNAGELSKDVVIEGAATAAHTELTDDQSFEFETILSRANHISKKYEKVAQNEYIKTQLRK